MNEVPHGSALFGPVSGSGNPPLIKGSKRPPSSASPSCSNSCWLPCTASARTGPQSAHRTTTARSSELVKVTARRRSADPVCCRSKAGNCAGLHRVSAPDRSRLNACRRPCVAVGFPYATGAFGYRADGQSESRSGSVPTARRGIAGGCRGCGHVLAPAPAPAGMIPQRILRLANCLMKQMPVPA
jgi:hypothetical protein